MIRLLADENIVGLEQLPRSDIELRVMPGRQISADDVQHCDVLWVRSVTRVDAKLLAGSTSLRLVGTATAGVEHVDERALAERGIRFVAAPGANANAVLEYLLAALVELGEPWEMLEQGGTLGLVGCGAVGSGIAEFARHMGWNLRISDPWLAATGDAPGELVESLDEILACPVISLHCALHNEAPWPSHHLLGPQQLQSLRAGQWLINAARGPVIDNRALLHHLRGKSPVHCVLDVWEPEPEFEPALLDAPTLHLATPHIAGYSWDAKWQATKMLYAALLSEGLVSVALDESASAAPALGAAHIGTDVSSVRSLIEQRYRIRDDDRAFREIAGLPAPERGAAFDRLRRHYAVRRELRGSTLRLPGATLNADASRLLQALGLTVTDDA